MEVNWCKLPPEVLNQIFHHIPIYYLSTTVPKVCQTWSDLLQQTSYWWKRFAYECRPVNKELRLDLTNNLSQHRVVQLLDETCQLYACLRREEDQQCLRVDLELEEIMRDEYMLSMANKRFRRAEHYENCMRIVIREEIAIQNELEERMRDNIVMQDELEEEHIGEEIAIKEELEEEHIMEAIVMRDDEFEEEHIREEIAMLDELEEEHIGEEITIQDELEEENIRRKIMMHDELEDERMWENLAFKEDFDLRVKDPEQMQIELEIACLNAEQDESCRQQDLHDDCILIKNIMRFNKIRDLQEELKKFRRDPGGIWLIREEQIPLACRYLMLVTPRLVLLNITSIGQEIPDLDLILLVLSHINCDVHFCDQFSWKFTDTSTSDNVLKFLTRDDMKCKVKSYCGSVTSIHDLPRSLEGLCISIPCDKDRKALDIDFTRLTQLLPDLKNIRVCVYPGTIVTHLPYVYTLREYYNNRCFSHVDMYYGLLINEI